jgi:O-antigen/teichoic acid export membrane protein
MAHVTSRTAELKFLLKHSAIYGVGNALSQAVAFVLLPLYTRYLTPSDYGVLELIDTTTGLIGIVVGLGVAMALSRFYYACDDDRDRRRLVSTVYVLVALGATGIVALANVAAPSLAVLVLDGERHTYYFRIAFASLLAGVFVDVGQAYLRMLYKSALFISLSLFSLVASVCLNVLFIVHMELGVLGVLYTTLVVRISVGVPLTAVILGRNGIGFSVSQAKQLLKYSLPLLPPSFGVAFMNYSDRYFIRHFASIADAGIYGLATKFGRSLHMIATSPFLMTFLPRRFQLAKERPDAPEVFRIVFDWFFLALLFLSLALSVFIPEIMVLMTTPQFYRAGALVPLALVGTLLFGVRYHVDFGILYSGRTKYYMYISIVAAAVQLVSLFFLVRAYGVWGAVFAGLISTGTYTALLYVVSARLYAIPFNVSRSVKLLGLAIFVYLVSQQIPAHEWVLVVLLKLVLLTGFLGVLPAAGLVSARELSQLRQVVMARFRRPADQAAAPSAP